MLQTNSLPGKSIWKNAIKEREKDFTMLPFKAEMQGELAVAPSPHGLAISGPVVMGKDSKTICDENVWQKEADFQSCNNLNNKISNDCDRLELIESNRSSWVHTNKRHINKKWKLFIKVECQRINAEKGWEPHGVDSHTESANAVHLSLLAPIHASMPQLQTTSCPLSPSAHTVMNKEMWHQRQVMSVSLKNTLDKWGERY